MSKKKKRIAEPQPNLKPEAAITVKSAPAARFSFFDNAWLPILVLLAAAIATYYGSLGNDFVAFDDDKSIWYNQHLKNPSFSGIFGEQLVGMYVPITSLIYTIIYQLFGEQAGAFHIASLLVHLLNIVLAYRLMLRLQSRSWAAFFVALLFAVSPMLAEAVSWVSALSTLMFSCFYLVTLHLFLFYLDGKGKKFYWIALLTFLIAGFSKSAAATLPLMLVALDWWRNGKFNFLTIVGKWPFWLISAGLIILTILTRTAEGHEIGKIASFSLLDRVFMISHTLFFYPIKLLIPFNFSILYPFVKTEGAWSPDYYLALPVLVLLGWWVFKNWNKQREIIFAISMYVLPLCLMLPIVSVGTAEMRNDRYAYLPSLGIFFLLMLLVEKIKPSMLRYGLLGGLALFFAFQAKKQSHVWKDGTALFKNCVDNTPEAALCQCNLGYSELLASQFEASIEHYTNSLNLDSTYVESYNGRGQAYLNLNKIPEALEDFTKAIEAGIVTPKLYLNRGKCRAMLGQFASAIPDLDKSLQLEPRTAEAYYYRAFCNEKIGKTDLAFRDYTEALKFNLSYVEAMVNRGLLYYNIEEYKACIVDNTAALRVAPVGLKPMILVNRANAYLQSGNYEAALTDVNNALAMNPNNPRAYQSRAAIYMKLGQVEKAQADLLRAQ